MRASPHRISLTENRPASVLTEAAAELEKSKFEVASSLAEAARRVRKLLNLERDPVIIDGDNVTVVDVAGLVRVEPGLELEVAPKFLGHDAPGWREDVFRIASLVTGGRVLPYEEIGAGHGQSNDLASLVGRVMVDLFKHEERRPIRLYKRRRWEDVEVDGDLEEESVFLPSEDGFLQEKIVLERGNQFNEVIAEASRLLVLEVEDQDVRRQLQRMHARLSPQRRPGSVAAAPRLVPSRHRRWQPLYDVALRVVEGFGMNFELEEAPAPGFVLRTWRAWEDLLYLAMRAGLRGHEIEAQIGHAFGTRDGKPFYVTPDGTVSNQVVNFLWDAKYKASLDRGKRAVMAADVYEANAFVSAAGVDRIALLYPRLADEPVVECGQTEPFETIELDTGVVYALSVETRAISARGGFNEFSSNLALGVTSTLGAAMSTVP